MTTPSLEDRLRAEVGAASLAGEIPPGLFDVVRRRRRRRVGFLLAAAACATAASVAAPVLLISGGPATHAVPSAASPTSGTTSASTSTPTFGPSPVATFPALSPPAVPADHGDPATLLALVGAGTERLAVIDSRTGTVERWLQQQGSQLLVTFSADLSTAYQPDLHGCDSTWTQINTRTGATAAAFTDLGRPLEVALTPTGDRVAYVHLEGGNLRVGCPTGTESLVVRDTATGQSRSWPIGPGGGESLYPAFDPSGTRVAFVRDGRVRVLDVNRDATLTDARPLSSAVPAGCRQSKPAWRPGSDTVLVTVQCRTSAAIVGYDAESGTETYRHDVPGTDPLIASYGVDSTGKHLIYALSGSAGQPGGNVYAVEPSGDRHILDDAFQVAW